MYLAGRCNAKFLWKRTPQSVKNSHPEIGHVWEVGKYLWNTNYPSIYSNLKRTWSDDITHIMKALQGKNPRLTEYSKLKIRNKFNYTCACTLCTVCFVLHN